MQADLATTRAVRYPTRTHEQLVALSEVTGHSVNRLMSIALETSLDRQDFLEIVELQKYSRRLRKVNAQ